MPRTQIKGTLDTYAGATPIMSHGRTPAFQHLGTTLQSYMTVEEGLRAAYLLDWNVRTEPLTAMTSEGVFELPRNQIIMRDNPETGNAEPIAPIGKQYQPVQNEEIAEFAKNLLDDSNLVLDAAGSIDHGRKVFIVLRNPQTITYGGIDKIAPYLMIATGHDGSMSTIVKPLFFRLACTNQLSAALFGRKAAAVEYRVRHTSTIEGRISEARAALNLQFSQQEALDAEIERLLSVKVTDDQWNEVVEALAPVEKDMPVATVTRRQKMQDSLRLLWKADTQQVVKNTAWAGVNAVGEYFDWMGPAAEDGDKRARSQMFGTREATKAAATTKALAVMGATA